MLTLQLGGSKWVSWHVLTMAASILCTVYCIFLLPSCLVWPGLSTSYVTRYEKTGRIAQK